MPLTPTPAAHRPVVLRTVAPSEREYAQRRIADIEALLVRIEDSPPPYTPRATAPAPQTPQPKLHNSYRAPETIERPPTAVLPSERKPPAESAGRVAKMTYELKCIWDRRYDD